VTRRGGKNYRSSPVLVRPKKSGGMASFKTKEKSIGERKKQDGTKGLQTNDQGGRKKRSALPLKVKTLNPKGGGEGFQTHHTPGGEFSKKKDLVGVSMRVLFHTREQGQRGVRGGPAGKKKNRVYQHYKPSWEKMGEGESKEEKGGDSKKRKD